MRSSLGSIENAQNLVLHRVDSIDNCDKKISIHRNFLYEIHRCVLRNYFLVLFLHRKVWYQNCRCISWESSNTQKIIYQTMSVHQVRTMYHTDNLIPKIIGILLESHVLHRKFDIEKYWCMTWGPFSTPKIWYLKPSVYHMKAMYRTENLISKIIGAWLEGNFVHRKLNTENCGRVLGWVRGVGCVGMVEFPWVPA